MGTNLSNKVKHIVNSSKNITITLLILCSSLFSQNIITKSIYSESLGREWNYNIYLPPNYEIQDSLLIIYLLHGSNGNENDWNEGINLIDSLIKECLIPSIIAVSPSTGTSWWVDGKENFETAFFKELKPYIEKNFKVDKSRSSTFLAGFSMGGYGALRYALVYPNEFSAAILLSPAIYNDFPPEGSSAIESGSFGVPFENETWKMKNYPDLLNSEMCKNNPINLFIVAGDDDWNHPEGIEFNIDWQVNLLYSEYHKKLKYPAELRIYDGGHDWDLWKKGLKEGLISILKNTMKL